MISNGYQDKRTLERRIVAMEDWLKNPELIAPDADAEYAEVIEIDLNEIKEPILACPNDPDDVKVLSQLSGLSVDEVFIGSCMTNIGHFRAASQVLQNVKKLETILWVAPPTRMDEQQLKKEGHYKNFEQLGVNLEIPGCSLCMGNQARVKPNATVVSTSTRNFPNRLGDGADVYLLSAELAAITAKLGKLPTLGEYYEAMKDIDAMSAKIYQYLNFNTLLDYQKQAKNIDLEML
jgi:aconitate hydratase 2/2-methylisocitrate dehydratase